MLGAYSTSLTASSMPTCRPTKLRSSLATLLVPHSPHPHATTASARARKIFGRKYASAAIARRAQAPPQTDRPSVRTVLHKAEDFLPRVLSPDDDPSKTTSLKFWQAVLKQTYDSLNTPTAKTARVAVYSYDEYSGATDLVTALLEEPFVSTSQNQALRNRWKANAGKSSLTISYAHSPPEDPSTLHIPATWLQQFAVPVEVQELRPRATAGMVDLFAADIPIIVCNPLTTPMNDILSDPAIPLGHANAILAFVTSPNVPLGTWKQIRKQLPQSLTTVLVDPARAISAIRTLSLDAGSSLAVQRYQDDYTGSRVSDLSRIIAEKLSIASRPHAVGLNEVTAREQIQASLDACRRVLQNAEKELGEATLDISKLRDELAELEVRVGPEVLGAENSKVVTEAVVSAKKEVMAIMDSLTWWRAVTRVDDVGEIVRTAVDKAWCKELEVRLIYHAGRLASSQKSLAESALSLLSRYTPPSSFYSPVLGNKLSQLQASSSYFLRPNSLTSPIHQRKAQLEYPLQVLHSTAQRVALGTGSSVMGGLGLAWAGWAEHLGVLGGLVGTGMETETAAGVGMLVAALGIRWMVGLWEKAKRRWWRNWDRVGEGLERDLKVTVGRTVNERVTVIPRTACDTLHHMAENRKDEIEALKEELDELQHGITQLKDICR
ncbi:hypothetical protein BC835DRAFT_175068 [Cytidiella melzeri]|nr:hypothetical protein BC835DRAFT_175068 [Cytidiella melzeri]